MTIHNWELQHSYYLQFKASSDVAIAKYNHKLMSSKEFKAALQKADDELACRLEDLRQPEVIMLADYGKKDRK